jgi:hypothetical protein
MAKNKLQDLRNHLFEALEKLNDEDSNFEVNKAKAICDVSKEIIDSAKLEYQMVRDLGGKTSNFFEGMGVPYQIGEMNEAKALNEKNKLQ